MNYDSSQPFLACKMDLYAFIGFIGPDDDINWLIILIFDY